MEASIIAFYTKHNISPVRQDVSDLQKHFRRREALCRHLGILPAYLKGKKVLEIGPGSGFNSLYTASLEPKEYVLMEGNPTGIKHIKDLFSHYPFLHEKIRIEQSLIKDFPTNHEYDFVFCEGVLSGVPNPNAVLAHISKHVAPGGSLIITTIDDISYFPDTVRRLLAQVLINLSDPLESQIEKLLPVFSPHLSRLDGMNRRHDDWIIDNLINPASIEKMLSIPEAIQAISKEFDFYASSPHFFTDWRWYKLVNEETWDFNTRVVDEYWELVHNFLDHSQVLAPRSVNDNQKLYSLCSQAKFLIKSFETNRCKETLTKIVSLLEEIISQLKTFSAELAEAFREVQAILSSPHVEGAMIAQCDKFGGLFGRGQQYIHFSNRIFYESLQKGKVR